MNLVLMILLPLALSRRQCTNLNAFVRFYKISSCYRSKLPVIAWKSFENVTDCSKFARGVKGLAFNFSPSPEVFKSCQVLSCPDWKNSSTLVADPQFDYYSAYGDLNVTQNATCIKSVGLFTLLQEKRNYSDAITYCHLLGGDLADILTESRTNYLASMVTSLKYWYKAAYIGLDDMEAEGTFQTPFGNYLNCKNFRAWSPGHPRPNHKSEDCVILDTDRLWRAINCKIKMAFICEFYPQAPSQSYKIEAPAENCTSIENRRKRRKCKSELELYNLFMNSSRVDQCALQNDIYK